MNKLFCIAAIIFISGCVQQIGEQNMQKVSFETSDGVKIVGNYWHGSDRAVLLLHMMPATKESWNKFAKALNNENITVLAIDLRGHGESVKQDGEILDFRQFDDSQHEASINDVEAAVDYLKRKNASKISIAGASIGANLALQYQSEHAEIEKTVLLSAGLNYRGVLTEPAAKKLSSSQEVFLAAGTMDGNTYETANRLASLIKGRKEIEIYNASSHGTDLFDVDSSLINKLVDWLKS